MTTLSYHQHGHHQPTRLPVYSLPQRVTQGRVIAAEWIKLRTQQSALWAGAGAIGLTAGFGILYAALLAARPPHGAAAAAFDPTAVSLSGIQLAQIAVGVLGAMLITSEYGSGMIRATFAAVPRRLPVLWGKAAVALGAVFAACVPAVLIAFFAGQSVLAKVGLDTSFGQPGVARAVLGSAVYLAVAAVLGRGPGRAAAQHRRRGDRAVRAAVRPAAAGRPHPRRHRCHPGEVHAVHRGPGHRQRPP